MGELENKLITTVKTYMDSIGFTVDSSETDGDYAIYNASVGKRNFLRLVFRQKGNKKHIDYFVSNGWIKGKSYRNLTGSPSMWECNMFRTGCSSGVFMVSLEYNLS